jgi:hypothetical protein
LCGEVEAPARQRGAPQVGGVVEQAQNLGSEFGNADYVVNADDVRSFDRHLHLNVVADI